MIINIHIENQQARAARVETATETSPGIVRLHSGERLQMRTLTLPLALSHRDEILGLLGQLPPDCYPPKPPNFYFQPTRQYPSGTYDVTSQWYFSVGVVNEKAQLVGLLLANREILRGTGEQKITAKPTCYLSMLVVDPVYRQYSLGAYMLYLVAQKASSAEIELLRAGTSANPSNAWLVDKYREMGWHIGAPSGRDMLPLTQAPGRLEQLLRQYLEVKWVDKVANATELLQVAQDIQKQNGAFAYLPV